MLKNVHILLCFFNKTSINSKVCSMCVSLTFSENKPTILIVSGEENAYIRFTMRIDTLSYYNFIKNIFVFLFSLFCFLLLVY